MEDFKVMLRMEDLQVIGMLQCNGILSLWTSVNDENVHKRISLSVINCMDYTTHRGHLQSLRGKMMVIR